GGEQRPAAAGSSNSGSGSRRNRTPAPAPTRSAPSTSAQSPTSTALISSSEADPEVAGLSPDELGKVYSATSLLWYYFTKISKDQAKCNLCSTTAINTPTGATTLLQRHLKTQLKQFNEQQKKKKKTQTGSVTRFPLDSQSKRAKTITHAIALFIAKGLKPYSVVEELGFKHLIFVLEPRYEIPARTQFSRYIIPNLYNTEKNKLQFINPIWELEHHTLDLDPFPGAHTADLICERMEDKIAEYNLNDDNIAKYVTSDNGSNMLAALEQPSEQRMLDTQIANILRTKKEWEHLKCFNHTGQLAIMDTKKDMNVNNVIDKISRLVKRYNKSRTALESFEKFQTELGLPKHGLLQRVKTRWNSDFIMMERAVEQK
ncbi:LOW QUALITY PROTEIN: Zinc finger BED domain-containing protein 4, partial [Frankliniella fusca]